MMSAEVKQSRSTMIEQLAAAVSDLDATAAWKVAAMKTLRDESATSKATLEREQADALKPTETLRDLQEKRERYQKELTALPFASCSREEMLKELEGLESRHSILKASQLDLESERRGLGEAANESAVLLKGLKEEDANLRSSIENRHLILQLVRLLFGDEGAARRRELADEIESVGMGQADVRMALDCANQRLSVLEIEVRQVEHKLSPLEKQIRQYQKVFELRKFLSEVNVRISAEELAEGKRLESVKVSSQDKAKTFSSAKVAREIEIHQKFRKKWRENLETLDQLCRRIRKRQPRLDEISAETIAPDAPSPDALAIGRLRLSWEQWNGSIPNLTAFPIQRAIRLDAAEPDSIAKVERLLLRLITALPCGGTRILACDPRNLGQSLGLLRTLLKVSGLFAHQRILTAADEIERALQAEIDVLEDILQGRFQDGEMDWDKYNKENYDSLMVYRVVVLFDVPNQLTERSLHFLGRLIEHGPRCGVLPVLVMQCKSDQDNRRYSRFLETVSPFLQDLDEVPFSKPQMLTALAAEVRKEPFPSARKMQQISAEIANRYENLDRRTKPFNELWNKIPLWEYSSASGLRAPIGWEANGKPVLFDVGGADTQHHALLAGRSGSGKSNLLHVLINSLCHRYSPEELRVFLLDFKQAIEFNLYAHPPLPHAALVATESDPEHGVSVLKYVCVEVKRRASEFKKLGIRDFEEYSKQNRGPLCRYLIIIDEFQELFSERRQIAEAAEHLLAKILRQGRATGVHVLLATQTLKGIQTQSMSQLISQIGMRLCLECGEEDSISILSATNTAGAKLKRPIEAILNNDSGSKDGNVLFRVPKAVDDACRDHLRSFVDETEKRGIAAETKIFEGSLLPQFPELDEISRYTRSHDSPSLILGRQLDYDATLMSCPLAKRPGSNLLCVGPDSTLRKGLLQAVIHSFASRAEAEEILYFGLRPNEPINETADLCPPHLRWTTLDPDWDPTSLSEGGSGTRLLLVDGLDYVSPMRSGGTTLPKSATLATNLRGWLEEQPELGTWTVAFADNWGRITTSCKELLPSFQSRVGFCLSVDHGGALVSGGYEKLKGLDRSDRAIFADLNENVRVWFRPFSSGDDSETERRLND